MARSSRLERRRYDDYTTVLRVARLIHEERMTQKQVADSLRLSQSAVSRLLDRAYNERIIRVFIDPPRLQRLEEALKAQLHRSERGQVVREVIVVPGGTGKNEQNLGAAAARVVRDKLAAFRKSTIRMTMSCGGTVRAVVSDLASLLTSENPSPLDRKTLELYPATLYADYHVSPIYPSTVVTSLANALGGPSQRRTGRSFKVEAFAASLPPGFYQASAKDREYFLERYNVRSLIERAATAQLFIVGIGDVRDSAYTQLLQQLGEKPEEIAGRFGAEIVYTPIAADGTAYERVRSKLVGVSIEQLHQVANSDDHFVVAVAGGESKAASIALSLGNPCFNVLVTDEAVAAHLSS